MILTPRPERVFDLKKIQSLLIPFISVIDATIAGRDTAMKAIVDEKNYRVGVVFYNHRIERTTLKLLELYYCANGWGSLKYQHLPVDDEVDSLEESDSEPLYNTYVWLHYWQESEPGPVGVPGITGKDGVDGKSFNSKPVWWGLAAVFLYATVLHFW